MIFNTDLLNPSSNTIKNQRNTDTQFYRDNKPTKCRKFISVKLNHLPKILFSYLDIDD